MKIDISSKKKIFICKRQKELFVYLFAHFAAGSRRSRRRQGKNFLLALFAAKEMLA